MQFPILWRASFGVLRILIGGKKLFRETLIKQGLQRCEIKISGCAVHIGAFQRRIIGCFICGDLFGQRFLPRQPISDFGAKHEIGERARCPAIAISERMNPVEPSHDVSTKMKRLGIFKIVHHMVAHLIDQFGNQMRGWRHMLALAD